MRRDRAVPLLLVHTRSARGHVRALASRTVVIATGAYDRPNPLGVEGEDLPHVSHYYTEAHPWYRKRVVVIGGANSAADAALELYRSGVHVTIVHRRADFSSSLKYWVRPDLLNRVKEGSIEVRLEASVQRITADAVEIRHRDRHDRLPADAVFALTGYHSDTTLLGRAGVAFEPVDLTPQFDPDSFETNVPGVYVAGNVTSGRQTSKIFIENGRFHGERLVQVIAARLRGTPDNEPRPVLSGLAAKDAGLKGDGSLPGSMQRSRPRQCTPVEPPPGCRARRACISSRSMRACARDEADSHSSSAWRSAGENCMYWQSA